MSDIYYNQTSSTIGQVFFVACCLFLTQTYLASPIKNENLPSQNIYDWKNNKATFGHHSNPLTGEYSFAIDQFEQIVSNFYSNLLAQQEPLGMEFEKVIHENLWNLYES